MMTIFATRCQAQHQHQREINIVMPRVANKRKSTGDIPSDRQKKVRENEDEEEPTLTKEEQRQRAKEWHNKRQSLSPGVQSRKSAVARAKSPAPRGRKSISEEAPLKKRSSTPQRRKSGAAIKSPPATSPLAEKPKRTPGRRKTIEAEVKPRARRQSKPLASLSNGSYGFKTIEERMSSQPVGLAPISHLDSRTHMDGQDYNDDAEGLSLSYIIFICISFGIVFASFFYTDQCRCLVNCLSDKTVKYASAASIPLASSISTHYYSATVFGMGVGVLTYFLLGEGTSVEQHY